MFKWVIILILVFVGAYLINNKIIFRFDTIFRKGFKRIRDMFRRLLLGSASKEMAKHTAFVIGFMKKQKEILVLLL